MTNQPPDIWQCPNCKQYFGNDQFHVCSIDYVPPHEEKLDKIIELLEKIFTKLEDIRMEI